jgi:hypothetical protein
MWAQPVLKEGEPNKTNARGEEEKKGAANVRRRLFKTRSYWLPAKRVAGRTARIHSMSD